MKQLNLSEKVKELWNKKGISQEALAKESGLSIRTIQRIENNESVPRGDALNRLAIVLNTNANNIIDSVIFEDKKYMIAMSLSPLGFLFFPLLGVLFPFILWKYKRNSIKGVNELGKSILNFELTLLILGIAYYAFFFSGFYSKYVESIDFNNLTYYMLKVVSPVLFLYLYNISMIIINTINATKEKKTKYMLSFNFIKCK